MTAFKLRFALVSASVLGAGLGCQPDEEDTSSFPVFPSSRVDEAVGEVDQTAWETTVKELSGAAPIDIDGQTVTLSSRDENTEGADLTATYLRGRLEEMGYEVTVHNFAEGGISSSNLIASLPGVDGSEERVLIGAHYDSTAEPDVAVAPGADDNASGVAAVLEVARILYNYNLHLAVDFALFGAEEYGIGEEEYAIGSYYYVEEAVADGTQFKAVLILDMISYYESNYGLVIESDTPFQNLIDLAAETIRDYSGLSSSTSYDYGASDHEPFLDEGIATVLLFEQDDENEYYHTAEDTFANLEPEMGVDTTRVAVALIAKIAGIVEQ
jgi:hypothetical protein